MIKEFLETNQPAIREIIDTFGDNRFSSHEFLEKFASRFETEYIDMLHANRGNEAFRIVHAQIALYLSLNQTALGLTKHGREESKNTFGNHNDVQWWIKE